jgi:hypothetical protein
MHMHAIGVPEGVTLLEFEGTGQEDQLPSPQDLQVQASVEVLEDVEVDCPDHTPCNFVKGKPWSIISILLYEINWVYMLYVLLH